MITHSIAIFKVTTSLYPKKRANPSIGKEKGDEIVTIDIQH